MMAASESCGLRRSHFIKSEAKPIDIKAQNRTPRYKQHISSAATQTPAISQQQNIERLKPLGIKEYQEIYWRRTKIELTERVFRGSFEDNQIRSALWPYLFGLVKHRGEFVRLSGPQEPTDSPLAEAAVVAAVAAQQTNGYHSAPSLPPVLTNGFACHHPPAPSPRATVSSIRQTPSLVSPIAQSGHNAPKEEYVFIEHEDNAPRWEELERLYLSYEAQWKAITRDQEERFSLFRERKALIGRDVIRCDRLHPFYAEKPRNLDQLSSLLMTYMMFDFDIGYVQGMSDLAGPILYIFQGDLVKAFWVFVEVMKLVRRNFEHTQKSIHFQLSCLFELIRITDPKFAKYLEDQESSNCFFAFRAIVCQFKRELMKDDQSYYDRCLHLWDRIWCVELRDNLSQQHHNRHNNGYHHASETCRASSGPQSPVSLSSQLNSWKGVPLAFTSAPIKRTAKDQNQPDTQRHNLTETELFILALCLVMIVRERDTILQRRLDGNDIHLHFIEPKLARDLDGFIESAINTYTIMKKDLDPTRLTSPKTAPSDASTTPLRATLTPLINQHHHNNNNNSRHSCSPAASCSSNPLEDFHLDSPGSLDSYDFLKDFLIINRVPGR